MPRWNAGTRLSGPDGAWVRTVGGTFLPDGGSSPLATRTLDPLRVTGFSRDELTAAFERIRNPHDWQGPIFAQIASADRRVVSRAIYWFTATVPVFGEVPRDPTRLIVTAVGYRLGPAGR